MSEKIITEKQILMNNIHELQGHLQEAYKKIASLHEQLEICLYEREKNNEQVSD